MIALLLSSLLATTSAGVLVVHSQVDVPQEKAEMLRTQSKRLVEEAGLEVLQTPATWTALSDDCFSKPACIQEHLSSLMHNIAAEASEKPTDRGRKSDQANAVSPSGPADAVAASATALLHIQALRVGDVLTVACRLHNEFGGVIAEDQIMTSISSPLGTPTLPCTRTSARLQRIGQDQRVLARSRGQMPETATRLNALGAVAEDRGSTGEKDWARHGWALGAATLGTLLLGGGTYLSLSQNAVRLDPLANGETRASTAVWIPVGAGVALMGAVGTLASLALVAFEQSAEPKDTP